MSPWLRILRLAADDHTVPADGVQRLKRAFEVCEEDAAENARRIRRQTLDLQSTSSELRAVAAKLR